MSQFDEYRHQVELLLKLVGKKHPRYSDIWGVKNRLERKIRDLQIQGQSPQLEAELTGILLSLNEISLEIFGANLDELTEENTSTEPQENVQTVPPPQPIPSTKCHDGLIFISHSSLDDAFVDRLAADLQKAGRNAWHDAQNIKVSQSIPGEVNKSLEDCKYFLVVLTPDAVASPWVQQEIEAALMGRKVIVPALLKDCERPPLIQPIKYADFRTDYESGLKSVLDAILPVQEDCWEEDIQTSEVKYLIELVERMCYNGDLSAEQGNFLKTLIRDIAMKKQKGEIPMPPADPTNTGEMFSYSSKILMYNLLTLADYRSQWSRLSIHNNIKANSLAVLGKIQDQILVTSALVKQLSKPGKYSRQAEQIITALKELRSQFIGMERHLQKGSLPYEAKDEMEHYFDDLAYHLNSYILMLDELSRSNHEPTWVQ